LNFNIKKTKQSSNIKYKGKLIFLMHKFDLYGPKGDTEQKIGRISQVLETKS
jgi:hypothetical protein